MSQSNFLLPGTSPSSLSAGLNALVGGTGEIWVPGPLRPFIFTVAGDITILDVRENVPHVCQTSESSPSKRRLLDQCGAHLQYHGIYSPFDSVPACAGDAKMNSAKMKKIRTVCPN